MLLENLQGVWVLFPAADQFLHGSPAPIGILIVGSALLEKTCSTVPLGVHVLGKVIFGCFLAPRVTHRNLLAQ